MSVDFARIQYLFELQDYRRSKVFLYGDKGVENSLENLHTIRMVLSSLYTARLMPAQVPDWVSDTGVRYQNISPEKFANKMLTLNPERTLDWDSSIHLRVMISLVVIYKAFIDHPSYLRLGALLVFISVPSLESTSNHKYNTTSYFEIDHHFGSKGKLSGDRRASSSA